MAALAILLCLLALWQREIDRRRRLRVIEDIRDARERGADRPLAQHPQIDELACIGCASCARACPEDGVLALVDGVARVVLGSRCIGHARCRDACPVGAIRVGLGDVSGRTDLPRLSDELETTVPGVFVAGELGGIALIRNAVEQGVRAVDAIARRAAASPAPRGIPDLLVCGAGPAGLAALLRATELGLRYAAIDENDVGGTVRKYPRRKLVMTQPVELPLHGRLHRSEYRKEELVELWTSLQRRHGLAVDRRVKLLGLRRDGGRLVARTSAGEIESGFALLALGRRGTPRKLGVPGEDAEKVLYQLVDAATYTDQRLLVVGGGDSAVEAALALAAQRGNAVSLSYRKEGFFRLKARNEERLEAAVAAGAVRLLLSTEVRRIDAGAVALARGAEEIVVGNDYVFVFAGGEPPYPLLKSIGIRFWGEEAA